MPMRNKSAVAFAAGASLVLLSVRPAASADVYEETEAALKELAAAHPGLTRLVRFGASTKGRDLLAIKISDNAGEDEAEPEVLFDAAIHGDESESRKVALAFAEALLDDYETDSAVRALVDEREIWIAPLVNPDGAVAGTRGNAAGVDLNRDFGYMWQATGGSDAPLSQPETRAFMALAADNPFAFVSSLHCGNEVLVYAWSYTADPTVDAAAYRALGAGYGALAGIPWLQSATEDYSLTGAAKDTYYGAFGAFAWSIELTEDKAPDAAALADAVARHLPALAFLAAASGEGLNGTVTDAETGAPLAAVIEILELGWIAYADPDVGDFHRPLLPGTYSIQVSAAGHEPKTVGGLAVAQGTTTAVQVALEESAVPEARGFRVLVSTLPEIRNGLPTPVSALGPPDGEAYGIGTGGRVVIDMGPALPVVDGPGDDVTVYEAAGEAEGFSLSAANAPEGPFSLLGAAQGTAGFDLVRSGLARARYFQVEDDGLPAGDDEAATPGFDLDAITGRTGAAADAPDGKADGGTAHGPGDGKADGGASDGASCACRAVGGPAAHIGAPRERALLLVLGGIFAR